MNTLYVLPGSHYCERAAWGLQRAGIAHAVVTWPAGLHLRRARRLAPSSSLPILAVPGRVIQGSGAILDFAGLPGGDAALEAGLEAGLGVVVRRFVYAATLAEPGSGVLGVLLEGTTPSDALITRLAWPLLARLMAQRMAAGPGDLGAASAELDAALTGFEARLGQAAHLVGEGFGRADLTAAALLAPLARPPEGPPYRRLRFQGAAAERLAGWEAGTALRWARRIYAEARR